MVPGVRFSPITHIVTTLTALLFLFVSTYYDHSLGTKVLSPLQRSVQDLSLNYIVLNMSNYLSNECDTFRFSESIDSIRFALLSIDWFDMVETTSLHRVKLSSVIGWIY